MNEKKLNVFYTKVVILVAINTIYICLNLLCFCLIPLVILHRFFYHKINSKIIKVQIYYSQ